MGKWYGKCQTKVSGTDVSLFISFSPCREEEPDLVYVRSVSASVTFDRNGRQVTHGVIASRRDQFRPLLHRDSFAQEVAPILLGTERGIKAELAIAWSTLSAVFNYFEVEGPKLRDPIDLSALREAIGNEDTFSNAIPLVAEQARVGNIPLLGVPRDLPEEVRDHIARAHRDAGVDVPVMYRSKHRSKRGSVPEEIKDPPGPESPPSEDSPPSSKNKAPSGSKTRKQRKPKKESVFTQQFSVGGNEPGIGRLEWETGALERALVLEAHLGEPLHRSQSDDYG